MAVMMDDFSEDLNTFFVDTKSTCFLCMEELPPSVCGNVINCSEDNNDGNGEDKETKKMFCLRKIFRYLKLDTEKIFDSVTTDSPLIEFTEQLLDKVSDFSVVLCPECSRVTGKLSALCDELEILQMKIDHTLQVFHEKLEDKSEIFKTPVEIEIDELQDEPISPVGPEIVHKMVADILRNKTKDKCCWRLKNAFPKVKLMAHEETTTATTEPSLALIKVEPAEIRLIEVPTTYDSYESPPSPVLSFTLPTIAEIPQQRDDNNLVTCGLCPASANSVFSKDILFQRHVVCCHLDFFFSSLKLPHFTMEQFKAYCEHLLEQEVGLSEQGDKNKKKNTDENPGFICHICGDIFHEVKVILVHMVLEHYDNLARKLDQLQRTQAVTEEQLLNKKRSEIFEIESQKFKCEDCGRVFVALSSLTRHKRSPCKQRSTSGAAAGNRLFACVHCGLRFASDSGRKLHTKRIHLGINHNRYRITCELCGKTMSRSSISRHKNHSCPNVLGKKDTKRTQQNDLTGNSQSSYVVVIEESSSTSQPNHDNLELLEHQQTFPFYLNEDVKVELVESEEEEATAVIYDMGNEESIFKGSQRPLTRVTTNGNHNIIVGEPHHEYGTYYFGNTVVKVEKPDEYQQ